MEEAYRRFQSQPVDLVVPDDPSQSYGTEAHTLAGSASVTGPGTFLGSAQRTLTFEPSSRPGWWIDREDLPDSLPLQVSISNVWTTGNVVSNIVLRAGAPGNYMRMVEHIIALRIGMGLDDVLIRVHSGDPPLFERGSLDLVQALDAAGVVPSGRAVTHLTVKEPVSFVGPHGNFVTIHPADSGSRALTLDTAIDFPNAIGQQRLQYTVNHATFRQGAIARTNTNLWVMCYCRTIGKIFADIRNLGYTSSNLLIAGPKQYVNEPQLIHDGKSLEAVWHRSTLDLLAAIALLPAGRLAGHVESYKAGHALDCQLMTKLIQQDLLEPVA